MTTPYNVITTDYTRTYKRILKIGLNISRWCSIEGQITTLGANDNLLPPEIVLLYQLLECPSN
jgi:hypothetical protein